MSKSDTWLLIYGRERQNKWLLQKHHFYCSPAMSKASKFQRDGSGVVSKFLLITLKDWQRFLFIRVHFPSLKNAVKI